MCGNNFHPFNLNYVTEMFYLLTLSIINTFKFFLMAGGIEIFIYPHPLIPKKIWEGGQDIFIDSHPHQKNFLCVGGGWSIYFL